MPGPGGPTEPHPTNRPPSRPWFGALQSGLTFFGAAWLLTYTLLSVPPVEALGPWNYVGVVGLIPVIATLAMFWCGHPYVRPTRTLPVRKADRAARR